VSDTGPMGLLLFFHNLFQENCYPVVLLVLELFKNECVIPLQTGLQVNFS